ncbi:hypothetical protein Ppa06_21040 [Planomonospora parontospora subsp. parontospora]|uniref:Uncharacterized protein n=2 Tax=Planomonospora parontospora TaxID=58119 RepID=A0AA37BFH0_9ACTN|nr:hypothetical protein GCM10010126_22510 [Planomonospora parontospora]GII08306.1 hypothetical protein Ppa06_21040 [Planomonospora parontospora subsp. parontospora]
MVDEATLSTVDDPALLESIRTSADLAVVGADAEPAARSFNRQSGTWLYDIPGHGVEQLTDIFIEHCRTHGFDARLERQKPRVAHRERVEHAVRVGGSEFIMNGVPVVAIGDLPPDQEITVMATSRDYGRIGVRWESISLKVRSTQPASTRLLGHVGVDAARLSLIDADGLGTWQHEEPIDGRADVAFWGRSVQEAVTCFGASLLANPGEDEVYGWANLAVNEAVDCAIALQEWKQAVPERTIAVDFRPHSHHWQVMAEVRAAEHEAGVIEVGGTRTMCLMTSWGDGLFPVATDHDTDGHLVQIRIMLGDPERQARLEEMHDRFSLD